SPAWPTPSTCTTRPPRPRSGSSTAPGRSSPPTASTGWSGWSPTTARTTKPTRSLAPSPRSPPATSGPARTPPGTTARSSATTGSWPKNSSTPASGPQRPNAPKRSRSGTSTTTTIALTPPPATSPRPHASTQASLSRVKLLAGSGSRESWGSAGRPGPDGPPGAGSRRSRWPAGRAAPSSPGYGATRTPEPGQFTSLRYGERLAEIGATPSIGTVGDSYDNALAETVNGYYKAELIRGPARPGPWRTVEDVELATLGWVHWHNHQRLHGYLGDLPPVEF